MLSNQIIDFSFIKSHNPENHKFKKNYYSDLAIKIAKTSNINLFSGPYTYTTGPSYETPAEISEIISIGGKAVGMSTFPEYLKCIELKLNFIIVSCLTNYGAGLINKKIKHEDVLINANRFKKKFNDLLITIIRNTEFQKT